MCLAGTVAGDPSHCHGRERVKTQLAHGIDLAELMLSMTMSMHILGHTVVVLEFEDLSL